MTSTLIVDHESDRRRLIRLRLEADAEDLEIVGEAASGWEAIQRWRTGRPEVILLDQDMPDLTGLEVARTILAEQADQAIIILTGQPEELDPESVSALGVRAVLDKRDLADLSSSIHQCLSD